MNCIRKILIANRGEIAVRILRTARALGYRSVAVFSDADKNALHVRLADEAVYIGGSAAADSYLNGAAILAAATRSGADAIHPGYGFLAENADFARASAEAGMVFIGPPAEVMRLMGDKARAKAQMQQAGVRTVPGYFGEVQTDDVLRTEAARVGYPLLVKAVGGGGGRGMRRVEEAAQLDEAIRSARREAAAAFADDRLMLERFVADARHIEIQVFADNHGHVVHLGERDCSTQRRRQKVVEETPSPTMDEPLRRRLSDAAVTAAKAIGYRGAGTVEFIVAPGGEFYFLEMNTRLQVEHPVTEMVTGLDLVEWQLRIAEGDALPLRQEQLSFRGHAIEARLCAEDPGANFAPQTGEILWFRPDEVAARPGVRIDSGVTEGDVVTPHYDNMLAKFVGHGHHRRDAIRRLVAALRDAPLAGVPTNQAFLIRLLESEAFSAADITTATLDRWHSEEDSEEEGARLLEQPALGDLEWALAAAWFAAGDAAWFRSASPVVLEITLTVGPLHRTLTLRREASHGAAAKGATSKGTAARGAALQGAAALLHIGGGDVDVVLIMYKKHMRRPGVAAAGDAVLRYQLEGVHHRAFAFEHAGTLYLDRGAGIVAFRERSAYPERPRHDDPSRIASPVAGTLLRLDMAAGERVTPGQTVAVVEAMKMEMRVVATAAGVVDAVHGAVGEQVEADALLMTLRLDDGGESGSDG